MICQQKTSKNATFQHKNPKIAFTVDKNNILCYNNKDSNILPQYAYSTSAATLLCCGFFSVLHRTDTFLNIKR